MAGVEGSASNRKPGASSSATSAPMDADRPRYSLWAAVSAVFVIVALSAMPLSSCGAVRVTVRAVAQVEEVKTRKFWTPFVLSPSVSPTATLAGALLETVTVAVAVGSVASRTV